ncbi:MAG: tetratricopeptide repeat protein [Gammaproteobacteria bacterium]|nr:tetratricopeptide repeat protein [Gammaproteobacteria bacterium]MDH3429956.1 tetratricopeptide repeat protein [Gammaproteobacteria bacterium]
MGTRFSGLALGSLILGAALLAPSLAGADSVAAQAAFDKANTAFRNGDYAGALAGYNDALTNGKDGSRLFYNMGLAHYRLNQYSQARWAYTEAAKDDRMAALAYYQLGVLANREGDEHSAEKWFQRSRAEADSPKLRLLSSRALEKIGSSQPHFESAFAAGFGHDSNAFRAPDAPYMDLSQDPAVSVNPVEQSGSYIPIRLGATWFNPVSERSTFVASYRHRGDYYTDTALDNANETDHRLRLGMERALGDGKSSSRQLSYSAGIRTYGETNFDRDDGLDRFDDGVSIADRFDYTGADIRAKLKNRVGQYRYEIDGGYLVRDYEDVAAASSYDLSAYWLHGALKIALARTTRLEIGYQHYARSFDERRARDANGEASTASPNLEYQYGMLELGLRHRVSQAVVTELIYSLTNREDQYVGYNDYTKHKISFETTVELSDRFTAQVGIDYRDQQYDNAFAFDDPTQPAKEYQEFQVTASALYRFTDQLSLRADVKQEDVDSSDPRGQYDRLRAGLSVYWDF